jgi:ribosome-binding protein aMBF1 (putative translation factor)
VGDGMTRVLEARRAFDDTRAEAKEMVDRARAKLGLSMIEARQKDGESQTTIAAKMGLGVQQVRDYESAYRKWADKHPGESLDA